MRLLIVGTLNGQLTTATKLAMDKGAAVTHAEHVEQALAVLRSGRGADLLMVDVALDIRDLVLRLEAERIAVPIVACGTSNDARAAVAAIRAGAKEYIPLPPDPELIAAVLAAVSDDARELVYRDEMMAHVVKLAQQIAPADIRIIATSNRNLVEAVREGTFREDLLFRLNVVNLKIPPLRERPADVSELAQHFIKKYSAANGVPARPLSAEARRALVLNRWPGNVRELENTIHRAVLLAHGDEIGIDGIVTPDGVRLDQAKNPPAVAHAAMVAETVTRALVGRTVADVERDLILETLKHCLGNRTHAANILGISIRTLRNKLNEYSDDGVPVPPPGGGAEVRGAA